MPELNNKRFSHLKIHTQYSICEGAIKIANLKNFCKRTLGLPYENVLQETTCVGQYIVDKLGFIDFELYHLNRYSLTTPP